MTSCWHDIFQLVVHSCFFCDILFPLHPFSSFFLLDIVQSVHWMFHWPCKVDLVIFSLTWMYRYVLFPSICSSVHFHDYSKPSYVLFASFTVDMQFLVCMKAYTNIYYRVDL
jgi:hypothetical protein